MFSQPAHALSSHDVVRELESNVATGLSRNEALDRLGRYGPNSFAEEKKVSPLKILFSQVFNAMTLVLILAFAASLAIKAWIEGGVLAALILVDITIGFFQDYQAAKIVASLKSLQTPTATVLRSSEFETIDAAELVPGDVIELKTGDRVAADARLVEAVGLETDEALLTGESLPARKDASVVLSGSDVSPGDRTNVVFASTIATRGRGHAVVFATGELTEIGMIAAALRNAGQSQSEREGAGATKSRLTKFKSFFFKLGHVVGRFLGVTDGTPLERKLSRLFLLSFALAILCAIIVFAANKFSGNSDVILYAIAVAIGSLPATLVLVLTITMAAGTRVMMRRNVAVRNMRSLEALGDVTNICSDKTGTLTQGKMVVRAAWLPDSGTLTVEANDEPFNPDIGRVDFTSPEPDSTTSAVEKGSQVIASPAIANFLNVASLANNSSLQKTQKDESDPSPVWEAKGDPTEIAINVFASRFGRQGNQPLPKTEWVQVAEFPFDSAIKLMSVLCKNRKSGEMRVFTKGACEQVMGKCSLVHGTGETTNDMTDSHQSRVLAKTREFAESGLRVLALAGKPTAAFREEAIDENGPDLDRADFEKDLIFLGLVGIYDPPRIESKSSVHKCHEAGIKVHMLTGDHIDTARTIAIKVGILPANLGLLPEISTQTMVMTAREFDRLTDDEIDQLPEVPLVVARCTPTTKVRMISALHRRGAYVAMTGDGVNDSPSLKRADIGIAMGLNGSDVAKSASDIILSDDNFASILNAIEEGRRIFDNVQKFMLHVLAANIGFVITLLVGLAFKDDDDISIFQLSPVEILFMLLVAGTFTENGLGFEAASPDVLKRPPQSIKHGVMTPEFYADLAVYGFLITGCLLGSFTSVLYGLYNGRIGLDCNTKFSEPCDPVFRARSTCFTVMMWVFLFFAWELIDSRRSFFYRIGKDPRAWSKRLTDNKPLFWTVVLGFIVVFPTLYIPGLNRVAFLHQGIGKEWGIVFAMTAAFILGTEFWKWQKRIYLMRHHLMATSEDDLGELDLEKAYVGKPEVTRPRNVAAREDLAP